MNFRLLIASAALILGLSGAANAAPGYATGDVNMRLGPGTNHGVIRVVPSGGRVTIHGCLQGYSWCDVSFSGYRGWVSSRYLQRVGLPAGPRYVYQGGPNLGIPFVGFELFTYHRNHYVDRPWYRDRYHDRYWGDRRDVRREYRRPRYDDNRREVFRERRREFRDQGNIHVRPPRALDLNNPDDLQRFQDIQNGVTPEERRFLDDRG